MLEPSWWEQTVFSSVIKPKQARFIMSPSWWRVSTHAVRGRSRCLPAVFGHFEPLEMGKSPRAGDLPVPEVVIKESGHVCEEIVCNHPFRVRNSTEILSPLRDQEKGRMSDNFGNFWMLVHETGLQCLEGRLLSFLVARQMETKKVRHKVKINVTG